MNIFLREMKAHRKSLIIWCVCMFVFVLAGMGKYEAYSAAGGLEMKKLLSSMPDMMKALLGFGNLDPTTPGGYFGMLYSYVLITTAIHAVILGSGIISKEERDKTSEFLMVKPVSRTTIITSKLLASMVNILFVNIATTVSSIMLMGYYNKGESITGEIVILMIAMFIVEIIFLFIGTTVAAMSKNAKTASALATGIMLVTYILGKIVDMNSNVDFLKYLTPFNYFEAENVINKGIDPVFTILSTVIVAAMIWVTYSFYTRKDLNI